MSGLHVYLTADGGSVAARRDEQVVAEGRLRRTARGWELTATPADDRPIDPEGVGAVLAQLRELATRAGGGPTRWLVSDPSPGHDAAADRGGLVHRRDLVQMRRPLPVDDDARAGIDPLLRLRPFRPGADEAAWLTVNNRAFADHPDQSRQTLDDLQALEREPWFDPDGFLLLDADAADRGAPPALDGFCWTKVHHGHRPPMGEIFVIGVDPSAQGRRLGPALTVAGLDHLAAHGISIGMLYVDVANVGAVRMYERLGFVPHHRDRIYSA